MRRGNKEVQPIIPDFELVLRTMSNSIIPSAFSHIHALFQLGKLLQEVIKSAKVNSLYPNSPLRKWPSNGGIFDLHKSSYLPTRYLPIGQTLLSLSSYSLDPPPAFTLLVRNDQSAASIGCTNSLFFWGVLIKKKLKNIYFQCRSVY